MPLLINRFLLAYLQPLIIYFNLRYLRVLSIFFLGVLSACGGGREDSAAHGPSAETTTAPIPFYAVDRQYIPLPDGVMPWGATYSPKGDYILFQDYNNTTEWLAHVKNDELTDLRCLNCDHDDRPDIDSGFAYIFPDENRMLLANELGDEVFVLECAPTLYDCQTHRYMPITMNDLVAPYLDIGARTYHLSPDGEHVGYTIQRADGLIMVIAKLDRVSDSEYQFINHRVVNPPAIRKPDAVDEILEAEVDILNLPSFTTEYTETDSDLWAAGGQLYELKSFVEGGRAILALAQPYGVQYNQVKIDLATGEVTPVAGGPDWDEDGAFSPDGELDVVASWRTMHRLSPFGLFEGSRAFLAAPVSAMFAQVYVSSASGFACDLSPWLIPSSGDNNGKLLGQPLNPYAGTGDKFGANNLAGYRVWSPDSTKVLLQGGSFAPVGADASNYVREKGPADNELVIAHIARPPTEPMPIVSSEPGDWALKLNEYLGNLGRPGVFSVHGRHSGQAIITHIGHLGNMNSRIDYVDFSDQIDEPDIVVNGSITIDGSPLLGLRYTSHLVATDGTGATIGTEDIDVTFVPNVNQISTLAGERTREPPIDIIGTASSTWRGQELSGIPQPVPCPELMPQRLPLELEVKQERNQLRIQVTATAQDPTLGIFDTRPVSGAIVTLGKKTATTGDDGIAFLEIPAGRGEVIRATAGDTFLEATLQYP